MNMNYLQIDKLCHDYLEGSEISFSLNSINLSLNKGELLGLIGPSGCGKTTLLRLIAGFEEPSKGTISIASNIVASPRFSIPPEKRQVGMVFQDYALFPHLNSWQNIIFGLNPKSDFSRAKWLVDILGLSDFRYRYPHELSGGQKQRVALARALAPGNSFVLLDEPFSSLDVDIRYKLRSELKIVLESCDACGILVTHDPQEALAICNKIAVMKNGEIHQCSTPDELIHSPKTSFVARFALHRNQFPVVISKNRISTPLGYLHNSINLDEDKKYDLLVDEDSLEIEYDSQGITIVEGREFLGDKWRVRFKIGDLILRVFHPLGLPPEIGCRYNIKFKTGKSGILFPGSIRVEF